jgi:hypothetical protein
MKPQRAIDVKNTTDNYFHLFFVLMTSLDHSLVHVLNKQEKISNV